MAHVLVDFYLSYDKCGTKSLAMAAQYLPFYKQCHYSEISHFVEVALDDGFYMDEPLRRLAMERLQTCVAEQKLIAPALSVDKYTKAIEKLRRLPGPKPE